MSTKHTPICRTETTKEEGGEKGLSLLLGLPRVGDEWKSGSGEIESGMMPQVDRGLMIGGVRVGVPGRIVTLLLLALPLFACG